MSKYLRDEFLKNLSLNESRLKKINDVLCNIADESNRGLTRDEDRDKKLLLRSYIIRFDNKGFILHDFDTVMIYFREARKVERIIFILDNNESFFSNKQRGKSLELRFDTLDANNCYLVVQDDISEWLDASFLKVKELLNTYKNKRYFIRNNWTPFVVQIAGVFVGFILSSWAAVKISPYLSIDYAFVVTFVLAFLIFSNSWTFIYPWILKVLDFYWPNISLKDRNGIQWLIQALLSTAFVAFFIYIVNKLFIYIGKLLESILK